MDNENLIIEVKDLTMTFGSKKVLDRLSFNVRKGEIFGLLGSNGSGKTTTLRCLLDMNQPDSGTTLIDGKRWSPKRVQMLGYLPEERGLYVKETVFDVMHYFGMLKGMKSEEAENWIDNYLKRVDLEDEKDTKIQKMSGGMQQKVQLGMTIMNRPDLLILDEPTKGLDPVNRKLLDEIIAEEHQRGATIVLVSHDMTQVQNICDRILLLKDGNAEAYGETEAIRRELGGQRVRIQHKNPLASIDGVEILSTKVVDDHMLSTVKVNTDRELSELLNIYVNSGCEIEQFTPTLLSMDEIFVSIYGEKQ